MKPPKDFKKNRSEGNAPDVSNPLNNPLLRYVTGVECKEVRPESNEISIIVRVNPEKRLSSAQPDTHTLLTIISDSLELAGASSTFSVKTSSTEDIAPNRINEFSITARGDREKIQSAMEAIAAAGRKMASPSADHAAIKQDVKRKTG